MSEYGQGWICEIRWADGHADYADSFFDAEAVVRERFPEVTSTMLDVCPQTMVCRSGGEEVATVGPV